MRLIIIAFLSMILLCSQAAAQPGVHNKRYREKSADGNRNRQEKRMSADYRRDERKNQRQLKQSYRKSNRASKRDSKEHGNTNQQGNVFGR